MKCSRQPLKVLAALWGMLPILVIAQVRQGWVARYSGSNTGEERAQAVVVDSQGNVYVTGKAWASGTSFDYLTLKYDANGNPLWVARYNGPGNGRDEAYALALDDQGNVYVTGWSTGTGTGFDAATIKYDANGNQLWVARYNGASNKDDGTKAVKVDSQGNVYVTGGSWTDGTMFDYLTIKYDANGNLLWSARYNGTASDWDETYALALDSQGNVYVTGSVIDAAASGDYATIKYDTNGNRLWVVRYNGPGHFWDEPSALAVDSQGNVYVTGYSWGFNVDYATVKYSADGTQLWVARYNGPGNDWDAARALAVDNQGNVYVTGYSTGSGTSYDYATVKYSADGSQLWVARYNGPGNDWDAARALAVDNQGNVYVTGESWGTRSDYATIKYDANGNPIWVTRYDGPAQGFDYATALVLDSQGNVYITGESWGSGTGSDYATIKYIPLPPGDVNGDGCVNDQDLSAVLQKYGQNCQGCAEDLNRDGVVNDADLALVLQHYGEGC